MYGWRGRIGIILPADNGVLEPDFYRMAPDGVATHVSRLRKAPRSEMPGMALEHAETLKRTRVHVIGYMCAASSFLLGPQKNIELCAKLGEASGGLPCFTASTAMTDALTFLKARRLTVLAPHAPDIAAHLRSYLEHSGFSVSNLSALGLELDAINDTAPEEIYRAVRRLDVKDADTIFVAATNFRAIDVIEALETDLGKPVVTSNQVAMWKALNLMGIPGGVANFGRLLRETGTPTASPGAR